MTDNRPFEEAALLNPAFVATVIAVAASEYENARGGPLPFALAFAITPLVLASDVRDQLPRRTTAHLANWVSALPAARAENRLRTLAMTPYTRSGIRFGVRGRYLELSADGIRGRLKADQTARRFDGEAGTIIKSASFVGRWFAREEITQVYALLGFRP
jgi:hypothetical protein